jgi:hypothetical protein
MQPRFFASIRSSRELAEPGKKHQKYQVRTNYVYRISVRWYSNIAVAAL